MKRILILGGSEKSIPLINYAIKHGYYTILCDYLPDNPGQYYVHEYHCISTTDTVKVLELADKKKVDGIISYSSDLIAQTAAYVGNKLDLPSNPYKSVLTLARKDLFRKFLKENRFNCPKAESFDCIDNAKQYISMLSLPFMVKPVDSAGSSGVVKVEKLSQFDEAFSIALKYSRVKRVIVEDYIQIDPEYMIGGDCFVLNGKVVFWGLLKCYRDIQVNQFVPVGKSYPLIISNEKKEEIKNTIQRVVDLLGIKFGGMNLELVYDKKGDLYIIEIAPRNGGNLIPEFLNMVTGIDLIGALVDASTGIVDISFAYNQTYSWFSTHVIHSDKCGKLKEIIYREGIEKNIIHKEIYIKDGEDVYKFDNAKQAIGILFLKFESLEEQQDKIKNIKDYIDIVLS